MLKKNALAARVLLAAAAGTVAAGAFAFETTSPSSTVAPYLETHLPNVLLESILTVDDLDIPKTGGGMTRLVGIPDGIGAIDGDELGEPGFFYLIVNHELNSSQGIARDHGNGGAFVSLWKVDKNTFEVVEGDDLIKQVFDWDEGSQSFNLASTTFSRFCSADRPAPTALFNSATGLGTSEILFTNGEEVSGGRGWAHVVTGADAGSSYQLEHFGFLNFENVLLNPAEQDLTIGAMLDDDEDGEVYFYVGTKQDTGNDVEKAGLVGGNLYSIAVVGKPYERDDDLASEIGASEPFTLKLIGTDGDRPFDGADTEARGRDTIMPPDPAQTFESLKFGGPEDGVWDPRPGFENNFYFVTKGTESNNLMAVTRLWQAEFNDITDPTAGGTLRLLLDGPENRLGSLDNMGFTTVNGAPKLYIQEDLGSESRLSKLWEYDITDGTLEELAQHVPNIFFDGGADFLTTNEESSGVVSLESILGPGWFAISIQVHTSRGLSDAGELVEGGQLILMNIDGRSADLQRRPVVQNGALWDYRVDGVDPGADWTDVGFLVDGAWNVDNGGVATGPVPTMLGYGESEGRLASDLVQPPEPRPAASYFRHEFDLANPDDVILFDLYMKVDDGAVVYINGTEVARYNMNLDLVVGNDTFASTNENSERDWKSIPINGADLNLLPSGNVVAVSVHQENAGSSDLRMDMELIAWNKSPDGGVAPAQPTGVAVVLPTQTSLTLNWDAQSDAKFFRLERQAAGDAAWGVIEQEYPGAFTAYLDDQVQSGVTYNYRLWAVNRHGRSALSDVASGTTEVSLTPVIFEEDFEVPDSFGQFTAVDVAAPDRNYEWVLWDFGSTGAVQGNNFGGDGPTEDWLITTNPINFLFFRDETLEYDSQISFDGPAPLVQYSTDYDPLVNADPNEATWVVINEDTSDFGDLTKLGPFDISDIPDTAYLAWKYTGLGGGGGESTRATFDDIIVKGNCGFDFEGEENADIALDPNTPWEVVNLSSALGWIYDTRDDRQAALNNNFGSDAGGETGGTAADDYLISPPLNVAGPLTAVDFLYYEFFDDTLEQPLSVLVTDFYTGDPETTAWQDITPTGLNGASDGAFVPVVSQPFALIGDNVRVAFRYQSAGNDGGTTKRIAVDEICVQALGGALEADFSFTRSGGIVDFIPIVSGGTPPYDFTWDFGDGNGSNADVPTHEYTAEGLYTVTMTVSDQDGTTLVVTKPDLIEITDFAIPEPAQLRIASYNVSMNRPSAGELAEDLATGDDPQISLVAEAIQRARPEIVLLNEFDHVYDEFGEFDRTATVQQIQDFLNNYLAVSQAAGVDPISYRYFYVAPNNTGVQSGFDLDNDGVVGDGGDGFGFGDFPGQFSQVLLSQHRILNGFARTFQLFRWVDMPGAFLPPDPNDTDGDGDLSSFYTSEELDIFRLSSKSHWDIPVLVDGVGLVHILGSHPTPPVFDDGTAETYPDPNVADWNGLRNHDEIRFWKDYINPQLGTYIYDDREWEAAGGNPPANPRGGLRGRARFVIVGDQNADPVDGDATFNPIDLLLSDPRVDTSITPASPGALEQVPGDFNQRETKTASFNLRADYALPSVLGWDMAGAWVFWPELSDITADLLGASDHRMVVIDMVR